LSEVIYLNRLASIAQVMPTTLRKNIKILLDLLEKKEVKN
jgi:hypothetical protein